MPAPSHAIHRLLVTFLPAVLLLLALPTLAQERVVVAIISDGPGDRLASQQKKYVDELEVLTVGEFDVRFKSFEGEWSKESSASLFEMAYADPEVDLVLAVGFIANQIAAIRQQFPKPTFLPLLLDTNLIATEAVAGSSGIANLNYLIAYANFSDDLDTLATLTAYRKLALFVDATLAEAIPQLRDAANAVGISRGVELVEVNYDGEDHRLMNRVPADTDAVFVAGLSQMPVADFASLIEAINDAGLASYSFIGVSDVESGLLATDVKPRDIDRQARLNALNMQAVMLGERAQDQPISTSDEEQLTINMATARKIGLPLSFDVLEHAVLLNRVEQVQGERYGLVDIAKLAIEQNQDLQAESYGVRAGLEEISRARANMLPQFGASLQQTTRNVSPSVSAGLFAERSSDATINLDQLIYSDSASANLKIQKQLQRTRLASLDEFRLDVIQAAATAYYTVLNARSQLDVQENFLSISRANLELAEDRVRLGSSSSADVYRWQAEVARAQIVVLNARAIEQQSWDTLNRILHKPLGYRLALHEASFNEPFVMSQEEFDELVTNQADYETFSRFYIERGLRQAPELQQLDAQIDAKQRELLSQRRAYWLPDFSIGGRYTSNLNQSGLGAGSMAGQGLEDWSVGVQATLPLFSGGLKRANVSKALFELRQLEALQISTRERVEERVRSQLHSTQAAYAQISLSATAAEASQKNYELVSDAYTRGTVTIIELLDAQDTALAAAASSAESLYNFLITIMALQRAVGGFDYLLPSQQRNELANEFRRYLTGTK